MGSSKNSFAALENLKIEEEVAAPPDLIAPPTTTKKKLLKPIIWIDLEMTGLDPQTDAILQIACIVTDGLLIEVIEGPEIVINQSDSVLDSMNEWCKEHHGKSGLTEAVRGSTTSLEDAETRIVKFVMQHVTEDFRAPIAGNSVHCDLAFIKNAMPRLADLLHYRIIDVSSIGELCQRWYPKISNRAPRKTNQHTAMADLRESIQQLKYYKTAIFKQL